jgi:hypothetical protein
MFEITEHLHSIENASSKVASGFKLTFNNGNTISVQFGFGNYCDNKNESKQGCKNAEIAIFNEAGRWHNFGNDTVKGWCNSDEVAKWIDFASKTEF